jgi:pimeloyl-ACP methyl ester carboxylesterase
MKKRYKILLVFLVLFILSISFIFLRPSNIIKREDAIKELAQKDSKFLDCNGTKIHYLDQGKGKTIVMIHGLGGSHRNFEKLANVLSKEYRVIRIDLPGFGLSEFPKNRDDFVQIYDEALYIIINQLKLDSVILMGNSMGGMISWAHTYKHPEKIEKLILMGSAGYNLIEAREQAVQFSRFQFVKCLTTKGLPLFITKKGVERCYHDPSFIIEKEVIKANKFWNVEGNLEVFFKLTQTNDFPDEAWIRKIDKPTLIIWGDDDKIAPIENASKFEKDIKNSKKIIYEKCGHMPQNECTQRLANDVRLFIN